MCYYVFDNSTRECCKVKAEYLKGYSLYKQEINQIQYTVLWIIFIFTLLFLPVLIHIKLYMLQVMIFISLRHRPRVPLQLIIEISH